MFIDLTEILENPYRTGIQRVVREIIRHWAGERRLSPVYFDKNKGRFVTVHRDACGVLCNPPTTMKIERKLLRRLTKDGVVLRDRALAAGLFNPEVFYDRQRSSEYIRLSRERPEANIAWLVYDFIPFTTNYYPAGTSEACMPYLTAMANVKHLSFISRQTRCQFGEFFHRASSDVGPALQLGADSLKLERQAFDAQKRTFVTIGSIEKKKNIPAIIDAFRLLWAKGVDVKLVVIGRFVEHHSAEAVAVKMLRGNRNFCHLAEANDDAICNALRAARATIFVSDAEGYGLPPIESLSSGIPVIGSIGIPSLQDMPAGGRLIVDSPSPEAIASAVEAMMDDKYCAGLWHQAAALSTPNWKGFVSSLSSWLQSCQRLEDPDPKTPLITSIDKAFSPVLRPCRSIMRPKTSPQDGLNRLDKCAYSTDLTIVESDAVNQLELRTAR